MEPGGTLRVLALRHSLGKARATGVGGYFRLMNITERLFNRLMVGAVLFGFLALMAVGGLAGYSVVQNQDFAGWVTHTYEVQARIDDLRLAMERAESSRRGFILAGDETFYDAYNRAVVDMPVELDRVGNLTADNPQEQRNVAAGRVIIQKLASSMQDAVALVRLGKVDEAQAHFRTEQTLAIMRQLRALITAMQAEEQGLMKARVEALQGSAHSLSSILAVAAVLLAIVAVSSLMLILRYTRDLTGSRNALAVMNVGLEATVAERTAEFKRANEEIQRFAYIVSHDLRSPLVNVMGFTSELDAALKPLNDMLDKTEELAPSAVNEEARQAIKVDLPESIGFIRSSTAKMDRLINAILRLSREGRRVISPEKIDMGAMLDGVAGAVRHQASARGAEVRIEGRIPDVVSDRLAIEQILSNLVENAVKYLSKDRPGLIVVRGKEQGDHVIYEVQDNGRGIDPKDHERVFDLFRRSGVQDQPGEGIGLAHVRAVAYRLGGLITCESALDQGATFRLSLPKILTLDRGVTP
jgi:signal transduction histidine kinase